MYFLSRPPERELLLAVAHLFRTCCPPLLTAPTWAPGTPCPAGHPLLPTGTRIYTFDEKQEFTTPALILSINGDTQSLSKNPSKISHWKIPLRVELELSTRQDAQYATTLQSRFLRLLAERLPTGNAATVLPPARLTAASLAASAAQTPPAAESCHVFFIQDVRCTPLAYEKGHTGLEFKATLTCATRTTTAPV